MNSACSLTNEVISATAPTVATWVALEQPGPWQTKAIEAGQSRLPKDISRAVADWDSQNLKLVLIRSRHRHSTHQSQSTRRMYIAPLVNAPGKLFRLDLTDPHELLDISPTNLLAGNIHAPLHPNEVDLVCTNGKRDICCAQKGRALLEVLERQGQEAWESTHLGGHRFSPVHLSLPDGRMWAGLGALRGSTRLDRISQALEAHYFLQGVDLCKAYFSHEVISLDKWRVTATLGEKTYQETVRCRERGLIVESCGKEAVNGKIYEVV